MSFFRRISFASLSLSSGAHGRTSQASMVIIKHAILLLFFLLINNVGFLRLATRTTLTITIGSVVGPIGMLANYIGQAVHLGMVYITNRQTIENLNHQVTTLQTELAFAKKDLSDVSVAQKALLERTQVEFFNYSRAKVLFYVPNSSFVVFAVILNRHDAQNIAPGQLVTEGGKLVGKVLKVFNSSKPTIAIELASGDGFFIPAKIPSMDGYFILEGQGSINTMNFYFNENSEKIKEQDLFVARLSNLPLPEAYVGKIHCLASRCEAKLAARLERLDYVDVAIPSSNVMPLSISTSHNPLKK